MDNDKLTELINAAMKMEDSFIFVTSRMYEMIKVSGYDMTYIKGIKQFSNVRNFSRCVNMVKRLKRRK